MKCRDSLQCGSIYHIYNKGNGRESLYKEEKNYYYFLDLFKKYLHQIVYLYAYCLLPTHFHLVVRIKEWEKIEKCINNEDHIWLTFRTFLGTYTKAINRVYRRSGHLFEGGYSRRLVEKDQYFFDLIRYIHQNPENHGMVVDYKNWPFSSFNAYQRQDRRSLIAKEILLDRQVYMTIMNMHEGNTNMKMIDSIKMGNDLL